MRYHKGDRVELHPATDWWMMGARYGDVRGHVKLTLNGEAVMYRVKLDHKLGIIHVAEQDILRKVD